MSSQPKQPWSGFEPSTGRSPRADVEHAHSSAGLISHQAGIVVRAFLRGKEIYFFVSNIWDAIQNHHLNGLFYETEELQIIARYFKKGGVFLDIGSNVGNHAIYVEKFLEPGSIILIEPNPEAINILALNLTLNQLSRIDTQYIGIYKSCAGWKIPWQRTGQEFSSRLKTTTRPHSAIGPGSIATGSWNVSAVGLRTRTL